MITKTPKLMNICLATIVGLALTSPSLAQRGGSSTPHSRPPSTRTAPPVPRDVIQDRTRDRIDVPDQDRARDRDQVDTPDQDRLRDRDRIDTPDQDRTRDRDPLYLGTQDRLQTFDRDRDGFIDRPEFQQWHESSYDAINAGGNDGFSLQEFQAVRLGPGPISDTTGAQQQQNQERAQVRKAEQFRLMDGDGNGIVTRTEYMEFGEQNYPRADSNGDGKLSYAELQQFHQGR